MIKKNKQKVVEQMEQTKTVKKILKPKLVVLVKLQKNKLSIHWSKSINKWDKK